MNLMQKILFVCLLLLLIQPLYSQVNETEAKAAYMLAEENYGKGSYPLALTFLKNAKAKLGGANCKILYLQIQIESELAKTQKNYQDSLLKTITAFQNSPDIKEFNEDKVLEVVKMKMEMEQKGIEEKELREKKAADAATREKLFKDYSLTQGWELGQTLEEAEKKHPNFFRRTSSEKSGLFPGLKLISSKDVDDLSVYVNDNKKIIGFRNNIEYPKLISKYQDYAVMKDIKMKLVEGYTQMFGFAPVVGYATPDGLQYIWKKNKKSFVIAWMVYKNGNGYYGNDYTYEVDESIQ
jgi:hypothetical protein